MQLDYHYYVVYHLSELAGLTAAEAETVAYASQYVDDSTESEPIEPFPNQHFDTARTAHYNLGAFDWDVQKKIYMPFHFLPSQIRWINPGRFSYVTAPASMKMNDLPAKLVDLALAEEVAQLKLVRLGVALHTIADTFSHFGFSGRHADENDVGKIWLAEKDGGWDFQFFQTVCDVFVPQIGHVEAFEYPDLPYLTWRYNDQHKKQRTRNNTEYCLQGAQLIYKFLKKMKGGNGQTADLELDYPKEYQKIETLFCKPGSAESRCGRWQKHTGAPCYDKLKWREEALVGDVEWDDMSQGQRKYHVKAVRGRAGFDLTHWACFHRAAHLQRSMVLGWLN
ncbi:MAG: hypothetical protein C4519_18600 [Desulfobacteraceae bacterium]|nr:MAG: hypothetical protein C4519_18600 [Desulfobacteraceae bacterium]